MKKSILQEIKRINEIAGTQMSKEQEISFIKNRLNEMEFRNQKQFDKYSSQHKLRPSTKVTIAGKTTTAGQATQSSANIKGSSVFGNTSDDGLNKKVSSTTNLPKKASELDDTHATELESAVNSEVGLSGYTNTDYNTGAIMYNASTGDTPTYTLYFGDNSDYGKPDEFRVSLLPTYDNDPSDIGDAVDKSFKSGKDAKKYMIAVAKKYKKELEMDDEN
jgi:hypothetical protein